MKWVENELTGVEISPLGMNWNELKWVKMSLNQLKWVKMSLNQLKWVEMIRNESKWTVMSWKISYKMKNNVETEK